MSPVRPSGGESLQEMIDRYNRELMRMGGTAPHRAEPPTSRGEVQPAPAVPAPASADSRTARPEPVEPLYGREPTPPRPEPTEPLYRPENRMPRPEPEEPTDDREERHNDEYLQGMKDIRQGMADREQGLRDLEQARLDREQGLRDLEQARLDREQGLRDIEQARRDREQGLRDMGALPSDGARELQRLREELEALEQHRRWYLGELERMETQYPVTVYPSAGQPGQTMSRPGVAEPIPTQPVVPGRVTAQSQTSITGAGEGQGTLIVQVYTARRAEPVAGAQVVVTLPGEEGERLYGILRTDIDGRTPPVQLPAAMGSEDGEGFGAPYSVYRVYVNADKYQPSGALPAQIFAGITGILPVELIPGEEVLF